MPGSVIDEEDIISGLGVPIVYWNKYVQEQLKKINVLSASVEVFTGS